MRRFKEDDLQMAVASYLDLQNVLWCHVGNERKSSQQAGVRLKKKGVKSGVPDVLIFQPNGLHSGLAIELKIKPKKVKKDSTQEKWLKDLSECHWKCYVCYSLDEVIEVFENYIKII